MQKKECDAASGVHSNSRTCDGTVMVCTAHKVASLSQSAAHLGTESLFPSKIFIFINPEENLKDFGDVTFCRKSLTMIETILESMDMRSIDISKSVLWLELVVACAVSWVRPIRRARFEVSFIF